MAGASGLMEPFQDQSLSACLWLLPPCEQLFDVQDPQSWLWSGPQGGRICLNSLFYHQCMLSRLLSNGGHVDLHMGRARQPRGSSRPLAKPLDAMKLSLECTCVVKEVKEL